MPDFPAKKFFGSKKQSFLKQRRAQLEAFFAQYLNQVEILRSKELSRFLEPRVSQKYFEVFRQFGAKLTSTKEAQSQTISQELSDRQLGSQETQTDFKPESNTAPDSPFHEEEEKLTKE